MSEIDEEISHIVESSAPTCYKHRDRKTWVSCGKCGKPLCPDCVKHGPVGVRCAECLSNRQSSMTSITPEVLRTAVLISLAATLLLCGVMTGVGLLTSWPSANMLLAGLSGMAIGAVMWRASGRSWSSKTAWLATIFAAAATLLASAALAVYLAAQGIELPLAIWGRLALRAVVAMAISALFAALCATRIRR